MAVRLIYCILALAELHHASAIIPQISQIPLRAVPPSSYYGHDTVSTTSSRKLTGKFLHITDIHPDPYYKVHSSTSESYACHRGSGPAGAYGAETTDCDSPLSLVNATFQWIADNIKDDIDFIVWTGDSARHDNDEHVPRSENLVIEQNQMLYDKFIEVFGDDRGRMRVPLIPTFGNNDIVPHNIFRPGPNKWTKTYLKMWKHLVPEEQRHQFDRGGWFYVEVIPDTLAVFSLNTMYFFDKNAAVDGCADRSEPGYEHMEWLRIQLQLLRARGMKAILTGHVPPARNAEKALWDETCYQKYLLWIKQYRDVVVGSLYGHMNVEHFILHDFDDIDIAVADGTKSSEFSSDESDDLVSIKSHSDYLVELRNQWAGLPEPPTSLLDDQDNTKRSGKSKNKNKKEQKSREKFLKAIGGEYGERFAVSQVSASLVPNYYPVLRVFTYNTTGLESKSVRTADSAPTSLSEQVGSYSRLLDEQLHDGMDTWTRKKKHKKPKFTMPDPPPDDAPPGPAYLPQPLSLTGYMQYYANITWMNNDFKSSSASSSDDGLALLGWNEGKFAGREPDKLKTDPRPFRFGSEYDTHNESDVFGLQRGLHVRSYIDLATRIGAYVPHDKSVSSSSSAVADDDDDDEEAIAGEQTDADADVDVSISKKKKKNKKDKRRKHLVSITWHTFVQRAFVGALEGSELKDEFGDQF